MTFLSNDVSWVLFDIKNETKNVNCFKLLRQGLDNSTIMKIQQSIRKLKMAGLDNELILSTGSSELSLHLDSVYFDDELINNPLYRCRFDVFSHMTEKIMKEAVKLKLSKDCYEGVFNNVMNVDKMIKRAHKLVTINKEELRLIEIGVFYVLTLSCYIEIL